MACVRVARKNSFSWPLYFKWGIIKEEAWALMPFFIFCHQKMSYRVIWGGLNWPSHPSLWLAQCCHGRLQIPSLKEFLHECKWIDLPLTRTSGWHSEGTSPGHLGRAPLPSPRVFMRLPSLSVLTHPQKGLAHQARSSVEFWCACHTGKTKEKTTSSGEGNAGQDGINTVWPDILSP